MPLVKGWGRSASYQTNTPYSNPFGTNAQCAGNCTAPGSPNQSDGFKSCKGYNTPVTVWRQNAPTFTNGQSYKICSNFSGKCLDTLSADDGAQVIQRTYNGSTGQKWLINAFGGGYYKVMNKRSNFSLDVEARTGGNNNGDRIAQWHYNNVTPQGNQHWSISPVGGGNYAIVAQQSSRSLDIKDKSLAEGGVIQQWYYYGQTNQLWTISPVN